ncbi:hypothetical protein [Aquimarina sp. Aq78]|nr:hypothetical protein [Aquimarina sp. Aq78]
MSKYNKAIKSDIIANKYETVAKVYDIKNKNKKRWLFYKYKFKNKVYKSKVINKEFGSNQFLNRYYRVDVNSKNPERDIIYLDREVIDSLEIARSGL